MVEAILKGFALGIVLALSVGPIIFTIIKQSITHGHKGGFSFVAGVWLSDIILVVLSNVFTEWVAMLLEHKKMIGYGGSSFLIAMGIYFFFFKKVHIKSTLESTSRESFKYSRDIPDICFRIYHQYLKPGRPGILAGQCHRTGINAYPSAKDHDIFCLPAGQYGSRHR